MFITTAGRTTDIMEAEAKRIASELDTLYVERKKRSVAALQELHKGSCMVVGKERLELFPLGGAEPFFFHPNSAMFRIKRLERGEHDPFVNACGLEEGMSFLDCTLGLASDSIVASFIVGSEGEVKGIEAEKYLSYIVKTGLKTWVSGKRNMDDAMRRIDVISAHSYDFLKELPDKSYDCVYFDPMFEETILESDGIKALTNIAHYEPFQHRWVEEAKRVAKNRVVLKDHYLSDRFNMYGFCVIRRKTAKFHFGFIEV